jgi:hypothetical protein
MQPQIQVDIPPEVLVLHVRYLGLVGRYIAIAVATC